MRFNKVQHLANLHRSSPERRPVLGGPPPFLPTPPARPGPGEKLSGIDPFARGGRDGQTPGRSKGPADAGQQPLQRPHPQRALGDHHRQEVGG